MENSEGFDARWLPHHGRDPNKYIRQQPRTVYPRPTLEKENTRWPSALTNGSFTGSASEIKYGWRSYASAANCRLNGDSLNNLITVAQGDTLEVRINGTTIEYYHNATLVYSLTGQTLSYPYRPAATFTSSTSPVISSATMTGTSGGRGPSIKTDRAVYPEPPLPTLPNAGGTFTDPVFGTINFTLGATLRTLPTLPGGTAGTS